MLRQALLRGLLFAIPFVAWFAWRAVAKRTGRPIGSTPWSWLVAAGALVIAVSLVGGAIFHRDNRGERYVPGEAGPGGAVSPGRFQ